MRVIVLAILAACFLSPALAQQAGPMDAPSYHLELETLPDGQFRITPSWPDPGIRPDTGPIPLPQQELERIERRTLVAPNLEILAGQQWYAHVDANGDFLGYVTAPVGAAPAVQLDTGESLVRVEPPSWLKNLMPDGQQIRAVLQLLQDTVREALCEMPGRPARIGTEVDISAGLGVTGRVAFNVEWETSELCPS